jgi:hypothetical protein
MLTKILYKICLKRINFQFNNQSSDIVKIEQQNYWPNLRLIKQDIVLVPILTK